MKLLIWDWDNTIANTLDALHKTYLELLKVRKDPRKWTKADTTIQMNYLSKDALKRFAPKENLTQLTKQFDARFAEHEKTIKLMPHAAKAVKWAHENGFTNVLASHKQITALKAALERHNLAPYFDKALGNTTGNKALMGYAKKIRALYPQAKSIYVIGDSAVDMTLGMHLGAINILAVRPYASKPDKAIKVDYEIHDLAEIEKILA